MYAAKNSRTCIFTFHSTKLMLKLCHLRKFEIQFLFRVNASISSSSYTYKALDMYAKIRTLAYYYKIKEFKILNIQFSLGLKSYHTCHFGMSFRGVIPHRIPLESGSRLYCTKMKPAKFVEANETFKRKSLVVKK